MKVKKRQFGWQLIPLVLLLLLSGCGTIRLVANYDENLDKGLTDLQKKVEVILTKIERNPSNPSSTYEPKDYEQLRENLNVLRTRAAAWDKNEVTVRMLYELGYQLLENPSRPITEDEAKKKKLDQIVVENSAVPIPTEAYFSLEKRQKMTDPFTLEDISDTRAILEVHFRRLIGFETLKKRNISTQTK